MKDGLYYNEENDNLLQVVGGEGIVFTLSAWSNNIASEFMIDTTDGGCISKYRRSSDDELRNSEPWTEIKGDGLIKDLIEEEK